MFYLMKVLIVDDNENITVLLSTFLNSKGFETVVTNDPMEGLGRIQQEQFDVILLDISMPEISGFNIIDILAREKILKNQNIFIFSANSFQDIDIKNLLIRNGINGYFKKPIQLSKLLTAITS